MVPKCCWTSMVARLYPPLRMNRLAINKNYGHVRLTFHWSLNPAAFSGTDKTAACESCSVFCLYCGDYVNWWAFHYLLDLCRLLPGRFLLNVVLQPLYLDVEVRDGLASELSEFFSLVYTSFDANSKESFVIHGGINQKSRCVITFYEYPQYPEHLLLIQICQSTHSCHQSMLNWSILFAYSGLDW